MSKIIDQKIMIRAVRPNDYSFIFSSFLKSLHDRFPKIPSRQFYNREHLRMERLLQKGVTAVVCLPDDEDVIIGWANCLLTENRVTLTYIYIKHSFRGQGIATQVLNELLHPVDVPVKEYLYNIPAANNIYIKYGLNPNPYALEEILFEEGAKI